MTDPTPITRLRILLSTLALTLLLGFIAAPSMAASAVAPCHEVLQNSIVTDPLQPGLHHTHGEVPRLDNSRLSIAAPSNAIHLAEPFEISLTLNGRGVRCVYTVQCYLHASNGPCFSRLPETIQIVPLLSRRDGSHYVTVTPLLSGPVGLIVTTEFSDGVFSEQTRDLTVEDSTQVPQKLSVTLTGSSGQVSPVVLLSLQGPSEGLFRRLIPIVLYASYPQPFQIAPSKVKFTLKTAGDGEVVRLDPSTGSITPIALGHALVTTQFAGATTSTCIVVLQTHLDGVKNTNCKDLLQAGETSPR